MRACLVLLLVVACGPGAEADEEVGVLRQALAGNPLRRPHWGSLNHGDSSGSQWWSGKFPSFSANRWPGCHKTTYYLLDGSLPVSWKPQVRAAFKAWDQPASCSPHWVETTSAASASVRVRRSAFSGCDPTNDPSRVWFACAQRDAVNTSTLSQRWAITFNADHPFRIATAGYHDVQAIVAVELAHVHHGGHNPNWTDSVSQANAARWGDRVTSAGFTGGELQSQPYTVCPSDSSFSCSYKVCARKSVGGCGNMRKLLTGDLALLRHIYGTNANGCPTPGATRTKCTRCCGTGNAGTLVQTCTSTHAWNAGVCTMVPPPVVDAGVRDAGTVVVDAGVADAGVDAGVIDEEQQPLEPDPIEFTALDDGYDGVDVDPHLGMEPNPLTPPDSPDPNETAPELEPDEVTVLPTSGGCAAVPGVGVVAALLTATRARTGRRRAAAPRCGPGAAPARR